MYFFIFASCEPLKAAQGTTKTMPTQYHIWTKLQFISDFRDFPDTSKIISHCLFVLRPVSDWKRIGQLDTWVKYRFYLGNLYARTSTGPGDFLDLTLAQQNGTIMWPHRYNLLGVSISIHDYKFKHQGYCSTADIYIVLQIVSYRFWGH